jgi:hypothetical protein
MPPASVTSHDTQGLISRSPGRNGGGSKPPWPIEQQIAANSYPDGFVRSEAAARIPAFGNEPVLLVI